MKGMLHPEASKNANGEILRNPTECRICGGRDLITYLDFGPMPLVNEYLKYQIGFPWGPELSIAFCQFCGNSQLNQVVRPEVLFKDYAYKTGVSEHFRQHCKALVEGIECEGLWVDIGGNDGTLLECAQEAHGCAVLNIDPSASGEVQHIKELFNRNLAKQLVETGVKADVITAQNVVAHVDDLDDFLGGVAMLLSDNGRFILEVPYMGNTVDNCEFDQIYHEHLSYFLVGPLNRILRRHGLGISEIDSLPVHGGSIRVSCHIGDDIPDAVEWWISHEKEKGYCSIETYFQFAKKAERIRAAFTKLLANFAPVAAIGACAKGTVLLNWCDISIRPSGRNYIKFIADDTPEKQGKFQPGTGIPIVNTSYLQGEDTVLILAWNWANEIMEKYEGPNNWILPNPPHVVAVKEK